MFLKNKLTLITTLCLSILMVSAAHADNFEITITNITKAQSFTPILAVGHRPSADVFELGTPASSELETLAEEGNVAPLVTALESVDGVITTASSEGLSAAGTTTTITIPANRVNRLTLAAMLIPTNDAFVALDSVRVPRRRGQTLTYRAGAYDSGTEVNDELCASIPGPEFTECNGAGGGAAVEGGEEGFIHIHSGVQGIGDISAATRDFNGPVAKITITRTR